MKITGKVFEVRDDGVYESRFTHTYYTHRSDALLAHAEKLDELAAKHRRKAEEYTARANQQRAMAWKAQAEEAGDAPAV